MFFFVFQERMQNQQLFKQDFLQSFQKMIREEEQEESLIGKHFKNFTFMRILGEGTQGVVYEAIEDSGSITAAIKVMPKKIIHRRKKLLDLVKTEIKLLKRCKNQNIIRFIDNFQTEDHYIIVTEFCNEGDLNNYLQQKKYFEQDQAIAFLKQILNGFKGLHEHKIMHRDFKLPNVLLNDGICKICDLGFAKQMEEQKETDTLLGTSLTKAPEILERKKYGFVADIWSIGVVFYQMLFGKYPYSGHNEMDILKKIKKKDLELTGAHISEEAKDFLLKCLTINPSERMQWEKIHFHPLLTKKENQLLYNLKNRISVGQQQNFYTKRGFQDIIFDEKTIEGYETKDIQFQEVQNQRKEKKEIDNITKAMNLIKEKEKAFREFETLYLKKRNDIYFAFKYIIPFVQNFYFIKASHQAYLYLICKATLLEMNEFYCNLVTSQNVLKLNSEYFAEFRDSQIYENLLRQIEDDRDLIHTCCLIYSHQIDTCSKDIERELQNPYSATSHHFNLILSDYVQGYWFLLVEGLNYVTDQTRKQLMKLLEALEFYKEEKKKKKETDSAQFDNRMKSINYEEIQKKIVQILSAAIK